MGKWASVPSPPPPPQSNFLPAHGPPHMASVLGSPCRLPARPPAPGTTSLPFLCTRDGLRNGRSFPMRPVATGSGRAALNVCHGALIPP